MENIWTTIGSLAMTGFVVSALAQWLKSYLEKTSNKVFMVMGLSILGGLVLYGLRFVSQDVWAVVLGVYAAANTVYLLLMKWLNPSGPLY